MSFSFDIDVLETMVTRRLPKQHHLQQLGSQTGMNPQL